MNQSKIISRLSTDCWQRCRWSVDWKSTKVSMECRSSIDRGSIEGLDWHLNADAFSTHDLLRLSGHQAKWSKPPQLIQVSIALSGKANLYSTWMGCYSVRGLEPSIKFNQYPFLHKGGERYSSVRVMCLAQEHNAETQSIGSNPDCLMCSPVHLTIRFWTWDLALGLINYHLIEIKSE